MQKIYGGFINQEKCTFNIYVYDCLKDSEGNFIFSRIVPTGALSASNTLEKRLFRGSMTKPYETGEGFVRYSKSLDDLEAWLNSYRDSIINDLKKNLEKCEANPVKIIEL